jgi:hypothetical protein
MRIVNAVVIARAECGWPPGVVRGSARQDAIALSVNQIVKLPRWRRAASYSDQFVTRCCCFGMWWRRSALTLKGTANIPGGLWMEAGPCHLGPHRRHCGQCRPWGLATLTSYRKELLCEGRPTLSLPIHATRCLAPSPSAVHS